MEVFIYQDGAAPGANPLAQGTLRGQTANSYDVDIAGAPGLALNTYYYLAVGGRLQTNDRHQNGYPTRGQLQHINGNRYTFVI